MDNWKNVIDFYTLGDKLRKQNRFGSSQSYSSNNYGGILLAYFYNEEYCVTNDISKVLRIIAMSNMLTINTSARNIFENMKKGKKYIDEIYEYYAQDSTESIFALSCREYDNNLSKLFDKCNKKDITNLYECAKKSGVIPNNMDLKNIFDVYSSEKQKDVFIDNDNSNSVYGSIILALALDSENYTTCNINKVIQMLLLSKLNRENLMLIDKNNHIKELLEEYDKNETIDSTFANFCSTLESNIRDLDIKESNPNSIKMILAKTR